MSPVELLGSLRRRGIVVVPSGDGRLRYRPQGALSAAERAALAEHRAAILAHFEADPIAWRAAVMATQLHPDGPFPLLLARPGIRFPTGTCGSCGEPLPDDAHRYRCDPCAEAVIAVLEPLR